MQIRVFTESKFKPETTLRFIHDPRNMSNSWGIDELDDQYQNCGTVLVPKSAKGKIDSIFQDVVGDLVELDLQLDETYGDMLTEVIYALCDKGDCLDFCRCKYVEKSRMWIHTVYHEILEKSAEGTNRTKDDFILFLNGNNPNNILSEYDYSKHGDKIMGEEKAVDFILLSMFGTNGHLGTISHIETETYNRFDEDLFVDCVNGRCSYDYKKGIVWESKSMIESGPDVTSTNLSRPMPFIKASSYKMQKRMKNRSKISFNSCRCSDKKGVYELIDYTKSGNGKSIMVNESMEKIFSKYFQKMLTKPQAKVAAKLMTSSDLDRPTSLARNRMGENVKSLDSKERHTKVLLRKKLDRFSQIFDYWPDLEDLMSTMEPKRKKFVSSLKSKGRSD